MLSTSLSASRMISAIIHPSLSWTGRVPSGGHGRILTRATDRQPRSAVPVAPHRCRPDEENTVVLQDIGVRVVVTGVRRTDAGEVPLQRTRGVTDQHLGGFGDRLKRVRDIARTEYEGAGVGF